MKNKIKTVVLYRVLQEWRRPIFERIASENNIDFHLIHGPDFINTKVVSSKKKVYFKKSDLFSFKIRKESKNGMIAMPLSPFLFFKLIIENPDVVITEGASNLFNAFIGWTYCKIFRKKYIWWSLGKLSNKEHSGFRKKIDVIIQYIEKTSDAIISYSSSGKKYFSSIGIPEENIFVAVNVVDTDQKLADFENLNKLKNINSKHFNILFVGALIVQKRIDVLLNGFSLAKESFPNMTLIIVGDGPEMHNLKKLAKELQIQDIEFTGKVFDGVGKYFVKSDLFVLPGLGGLAVSEAMCYQLPVIASIGDGCEKDLIINGVNGIIDENLTSERLARHILDLLEQPEKLKQYQENAQRQIINTYNVNTYLQEVLNAIYFVKS